MRPDLKRPRYVSVTTLFNGLGAQRLSFNWSLGFGTVQIGALNRLSTFLDPRQQAGRLPDADVTAFTTDLLREFLEDERLFSSR